MSTATHISFGYKRPRFFRSHESAYRSGLWLRAALFGDGSARQECRAKGIEIRREQGAIFGSQTRTSQQDDDGLVGTGSYLVPDELAESIITLREKYGVIAADARTQPMKSETLTIPRRPLGSGVTATYAQNNVAATGTQLNFDGVGLTARKLYALVIMSSEFAEDAVVELADLFADEFGWAFAKAEDQAGFVASGTSADSHQVGACTLFTNGNSTAGLFTAAGTHTTFATLTAADFTSTQGLLPAAYQPTARWYTSPACFSDAMQRLSAAVGWGSSMNVEGIPAPSFAAHMVRLVPSMVSSTGSEVNQIASLYGDLSKAVVVGRLRQLTVRMSDQRYLEYDQLALLGSQRFHVVAHGCGDTVNAGALVALQFAAS